ncbi:MAG TPA: ComF family protein [Syntrophorhabdaceae bacterium]|nr:ComF family protein [Syntrophorhabdaceae bacterium]
MNSKIPFQRAYFGYYFEDRLRDAIHAFKFNGRIEAGKYLIQLMKQRLLPMRDSIDCIVPVPVTAKRLYTRGFNQSFIIGEEISKIIAKSIYPSVLVKERETKDQFMLSRKDRKQNVRGVFAVRNRDQISGKRVLLVDDLFTTGYTAFEASRLLIKSSAKEVIFFALARTPS